MPPKRAAEANTELGCSKKPRTGTNNTTKGSNLPEKQPRKRGRPKKTQDSSKATSSSTRLKAQDSATQLDEGTSEYGANIDTGSTLAPNGMVASSHGKPLPTEKIAGRRRRKHIARTGTHSPSPTRYADLAGNASEAMQTSGKSATTINRYKQLLEDFRDFLRSYQRKEVDKEKTRQQNNACGEPDDEAHAAPGEDPSDSADAPTTMDPDFPYALDGLPETITPFAIALFIYERCGPGKNGISEAWQIYSAVAWHYDEMDGDKYRNWWTWDSSSQSWIGNPARSACVKSMLASVKNIHAQDNRNHSRATSVGDMQAMHKARTSRLQELEGLTDLKSRRERAGLLLFGALSTLAWLVWLRCNEVVNLTVGDLLLSPPESLRSDGSAFVYLILSVCKRKNWTRKDEAELTGHIYHLYQRKDHAAIDAFTHLQEWLAEYQDILGRPLCDEDVLFPTINPSMCADATHAINEDHLRKLIRTHATNAGLPHVDGYKTHCFRRGGSQYRFMYAPLDQRWTLARIRWWGGWAKSETGETLMKYLLDELFTYEEDHRDALQPDEDGRTTDLKGLAEQKELQTATKVGTGGLSEDAITATIAQAVRGVLANEFAIHRSHVGRFQGATSLSSYDVTPPQHHPIHAPQAAPASSLLPSSQHPRWISPSYTPTHLHPPMRSYHLAHHHIDDQASFVQRHTSSQDFHLHGHTAFSVARQPPIHTQRLPEHTHHWDSRHQSNLVHRALQTASDYSTPLQPLASPQPLPSTGHDAVSTSPHGRLVVPKIGRSTKPEVIANLWKQVIDDWEVKDPRRCPVPLRDWKENWHRGTPQAMIYHHRKLVATEFIDACNRNEVVFCERYPEHVNGVSALVVAITAARKARGDARRRTGKNG